MGVALIKFSEACDVVVGAAPVDPTQPISNPQVVGRTNRAFIIVDAKHCFSLQGASKPFTPKWQFGQVSPAAVLELDFT